MESTNIIVPCDGTWSGLHTNTNVKRLATLISQISSPIRPILPPNRIFPGVGIDSNENSNEDYIEGAIATDLDDKVKEAYKFVAQNYNPDKINNVWLFGFSRGAYTVRSVAGMIRNCGIVKEANNNIIDEAYDIYRSRKKENSPDQPKAAKFRENSSYTNSQSVFFLGLWDTVGAHGLPSYNIDKGFEYVKFHDKFISSHVKYAYQALAVHEDLEFFEPCNILKSINTKNTVEEIWFPGVHGEIGGSNQNNPISNHTLNWMIDKINNTRVLANIERIHVTPLSPLPVKNKNIFSPTDFLWKHILKHHLHRDREIPGLKVEILYNEGREWSTIARGTDYSSNAYNTFRKKLQDNSIPFPPDFS